MVAGWSALVAWIYYLFGVPGTDECSLSWSCHVTWTNPSDLSLSFPGYRLPPLSFSVPLLLLPPGNQRSLGLHNTRASPLSRSPNLDPPPLAPGVPCLHPVTIALAVSAALGFPLSLPELRALTAAGASPGPSGEGIGIGQKGQPPTSR